jgi:hypothetical protein
VKWVRRAVRPMWASMRARDAEAVAEAAAEGKVVLFLADEVEGVGVRAEDGGSTTCADHEDEGGDQLLFAQADSAVPGGDEVTGHGFARGFRVWWRWGSTCRPVGLRGRLRPASRGAARVARDAAVGGELFDDVVVRHRPRRYAAGKFHQNRWAMGAEVGGFGVEVGAGGVEDGAGLPFHAGAPSAVGEGAGGGQDGPPVLVLHKGQDVGGQPEAEDGEGPWTA